MIRVLLVDDHQLLREGTCALLNEAPDIEVVAEVGEGAEALILTEQLEPDIVVLDIRLQDMNGIDVARTLRQDFPHVKILILSAYHYEQYVRALFAIGVHGYLLKSASAPELINAVQSIYQGQTVLSSEISNQLALRARNTGIAATNMLSEREQEVLELVGRGASNKEIALQLGIATRTVETHVSNAMAKLTAHSRTEAVNIAIQRGIIAPP
ncbi:MAG: DNA-binding response regulator, NarL/FixJ family, contains REC and HTH domains [Chloroflexi bacterium AL-W]|nr:DNA-binding response regulator, NarL/FixJ family, contains REC and HTH domains [Chloroflexi bacterium AL-N1]NOK67158.1 DNA-binding response regulator, NarL/FixJ family, contains REC and HTH domains [Chloroflexi bacterium AL-N10]NOK74549.1 DNA-binding response regulator, NarL/FixJ family, contains REC and HTH domains [Chloroflexi bacterium AL-N5]NOK81760.1 DNA-binding response regulator, NarL/FixJ family, contains REC and HTH domains [Chloroflexi bacterium AL-W]NOK89230.1 DNA-binding response